MRRSERWRIFCPTYQRQKNAHVSKAAWALPCPHTNNDRNDNNHSSYEHPILNLDAKDAEFLDEDTQGRLPPCGTVWSARQKRYYFYISWPGAQFLVASFYEGLERLLRFQLGNGSGGSIRKQLRMVRVITGIVSLIAIQIAAQSLGDRAVALF